MTTLLPSHYRPSKPEHLIGPARAVCDKALSLIERSEAGGHPVRLMLTGDPGLGKSRISQILADRLGSKAWNTIKRNGTAVKVDALEDIERHLSGTSLLAGYRLLWIEEVDTVPRVAQTRLLTVLDDLPPWTAVLTTSNKSDEAFEPRFQSRFVVLPVAAPTAEEITDFLCKGWAIAENTARSIAHMACGNMRQALLDADASVL